MDLLKDGIHIYIRTVLIVVLVVSCCCWCLYCWRVLYVCDAVAYPVACVAALLKNEAQEWCCAMYCRHRSMIPDILMYRLP